MAVALPTAGILSFGYERTAEHTHQGIDLPAPEGEGVYNVWPGWVTHARATTRSGFSGYGAHVAVAADDGTHHLYAHLSEVRVAPGEYVHAGKLLGRVGRTCYTVEDPTRLCDGAHLHFEVSPRPYPQDSEAPRLDPVAYLTERRAHPLSRPRLGLGLGLVAALGLTWFVGRKRVARLLRLR